MKTNTPVITASEVVCLLYKRLGTLRAWADFLADNIRGKQSINGITLMPCARKQDARTLRPVYSVSSVRAFVIAVLKADPTAGPAMITPSILAVDTGRHWHINKFAPDGSTMLHRINYGTRSSHAH